MKDFCQSPSGLPNAGLVCARITALAMRGPDGSWMYHLQAAGGIVADSDAGAEYQETVNKAAALARAIDVAEGAFGR